MGFHATGTDVPAWKDKDILLAEIKTLKAERDRLRAALSSLESHVPKLVAAVRERFGIDR